MKFSFQLFLFSNTLFLIIAKKILREQYADRDVKMMPKILYKIPTSLQCEKFWKNNHKSRYKFDLFPLLDLLVGCKVWLI